MLVAQNDSLVGAKTLTGRCLSSNVRRFETTISIATISESISSDKAYQVSARNAAFLTRQAEASIQVYYSDLAKELGMPNPRNLNYMLGRIE